MTVQQERRLMNRARVLDFLRGNPNKTDVEISKMADLSYMDTIQAIAKLELLKLVQQTGRRKCSYTLVNQNTFNLTDSGADIMNLPANKRKI
jgi:hypothetical protein